MRPTPAEVARTLAAGRLLGVAHLCGYPSRLRVRHATGADGDPVLLTRNAGELAAALCPAPGEDDTAIVLSVDDVPPVAGAPSHGRLWISGRVTRLHGSAARAAAIDYAGVNPTGDLLDVGHGHVLHRLIPAEVRLARADTLIEVDVEEFRAAEPDPLHTDEPRLLADLNDHHREQLAALVGQVTGGPAAQGCRAVRLDRYGLVLAPGCASDPGRRLRLGFPRPVTGLCELAHLLHALLCPARDPGADVRSSRGAR